MHHLLLVIGVYRSPLGTSDWGRMLALRSLEFSHPSLGAITHSAH